MSGELLATNSGPGIDVFWVLACTILVMGMQAGFACLESGLVRAKNSINVAIKNVADFCLSSLVYWCFGFGIMFGASTLGWIGMTDFLFGHADPRDFYSAQTTAFFLFQLAFCGTAVTIVSGAVAERMKFSGYLIVAGLLSGIVYPVFGHWAWGGALYKDAPGWLAQMGFVDFAGSTVVHSTGGWIALAAILTIGPRIGRFGPQGKAIEGHDIPLAALGMFLLWLGWFGFNGGSTLLFSNNVPPILLNTLLASCAGGMAALALSWCSGNRGPNVVRTMCGVLAGLVSITAGCHAVGPVSAIIIGATGGIIAIFASNLLIWAQIDDAVDAIPVHLAAGIWGTLAVALFGNLEILGTGLSRPQQLFAQFAGIAANGFYAFTIGFFLLKIANYFSALRVSAYDEKRGLNVSEHGASTALFEVLEVMERQRNSGDFTATVPVEPFTEAGEVARRYNGVRKRFVSEVAAREQVAVKLRQAKEEADIANAAKSQFLANMSHELRTPLNAIIGFSEIMNTELMGPVGTPQYKEYAQDIHNAGQHLLSLINDILDLSKIDANKRELEETQFNLFEAVESVMPMIRRRAEENNVQLSNNVPADFPYIWADLRAMRQIILNLLSNAVKFTPSGGAVSVTALIEADGRIAIQIEDTGIGIARSQIDRALLPFEQIGDTSNAATTNKAQGTGLGLPLVAALVRLHCGTFLLESEPGVGTRAIVRLPADRIVKSGQKLARI